MLDRSRKQAASHHLRRMVRAGLPCRGSTADVLESVLAQGPSCMAGPRTVGLAGWISSFKGSIVEARVLGWGLTGIVHSGACTAPRLPSRSPDTPVVGPGGRRVPGSRPGPQGQDLAVFVPDHLVHDAFPGAAVHPLLRVLCQPAAGVRLSCCLRSQQR